MSKHTYQSTWSREFDAPLLQPSSAELHTYTGGSITVLRSINVNVTFRDCAASLELLIIEGEGPTLMDRNWLSHFPNIHWQGFI